MNKTLVFFAVAVMTLVPVTASARSILPAISSEPAFTDLNGVKLDEARVDTQVMISTTLGNNLDEEIAFIGLFEVRDAAGITVYLAWQTVFLEPKGRATIGGSWLAATPVDHQARSFAVTDLDNPQVLSSVASTTIEIR